MEMLEIFCIWSGFVSVEDYEIENNQIQIIYLFITEKQQQVIVMFYGIILMTP